MLWKRVYNTTKQRLEQRQRGEVYAENYRRRFVCDGSHRRPGCRTAARWRNERRRQRPRCYACPQAGPGTEGKADGSQTDGVQTDGIQADDAQASRHGASSLQASPVVGLASSPASRGGGGRRLAASGVVAQRLELAPRGGVAQRLELAASTAGSASSLALAPSSSLVVAPSSSLVVAPSPPSPLDASPHAPHVGQEELTKAVPGIPKTNPRTDD